MSQKNHTLQTTVSFWNNTRGKISVYRKINLQISYTER